MIHEVDFNLTQGERQKKLREFLPFYVSNSHYCFYAKDVSNTCFRDEERIEMYALSTKEKMPFYPKGTKKLKITRGLIISDNIEEAQLYYREKRALRIKEEFPEIKKKYLDYSKFIKENVELFV